ncbi:response regulator [Niallia sp. 03133]|uniref:response regulator n=1 Tax=Niallia sp. 03133 TaxID=3458060 RepID=UPI0040448549
MISVLIVEDDPMVAEFNKQFLHEVQGFTLSGLARNVEEALQILETENVDLILLDVFMPGKSGLEFLSYIRKAKENVDVIVITAASDIENIQAALRLGAVDYIIKPFQFQRFKESLTTYFEKVEFMKEQKHVSQTILDEQILKREQKEHRIQLPKGLTKETLKIVWNIIKKHRGEFTTEIIAEETNISRVSIRKYLNFLTDLGIVDFQLIYGGIGRPVNVFYINQQKTKLINQFL